MVANWTDWHAYWLERHAYRSPADRTLWQSSDVGGAGGTDGGGGGGGEARLLAVPYEALLADPGGVLARVLQFTGYRHVRCDQLQELVRALSRA